MELCTLRTEQLKRGNRAGCEPDSAPPPSSCLPIHTPTYQPRQKTDQLVTLPDSGGTRPSCPPLGRDRARGRAGPPLDAPPSLFTSSFSPPSTSARPLRHSHFEGNDGGRATGNSKCASASSTRACRWTSLATLRLWVFLPLRIAALWLCFLFAAPLSTSSSISTAMITPTPHLLRLEGQRVGSEQDTGTHAALPVGYMVLKLKR